MRVLFLHNRYRQPGGEDQVALAEARLLRAAGIETKLVLADNREASAWSALEAAWSEASYRRVRRLCLEYRPDIAHVHNFWMQLTPSVHAACRDAGAATVQTLHNFRLLCANALLLREDRPCEDCVGRSSWTGVARRCYRNSLLASAAVVRMIAANRRRGTWDHDVRAFIALSDFARRRFVEGGLPAERVFVKPNFVADPGPVEAPPSASGDILYAGRLSREKGVHVLVTAWRRGRLNHGARLLIVGDGPERRALEAQAGADGVVFTGWKSPREIRDLMPGVRAVVLPSLCYENQPRALVEAFSFARPVIVSDLGGLAEAVQDQGLRVPAGDEEALSDALAAVTRDAALADRLGRNARATYLERYTPQRNCEMLLDIYRRAAA